VGGKNPVRVRNAEERREDWADWHAEEGAVLKRGRTFSGQGKKRGECTVWTQYSKEKGYS